MREARIVCDITLCSLLFGGVLLLTCIACGGAGLDETCTVDILSDCDLEVGSDDNVCVEAESNCPVDEDEYYASFSGAGTVQNARATIGGRVVNLVDATGDANCERLGQWLCEEVDCQEEPVCLKTAEAHAISANTPVSFRAKVTNPENIKAVIASQAQIEAGMKPIPGQFSSSEETEIIDGPFALASDQVILDAGSTDHSNGEMTARPDPELHMKRLRAGASHFEEGELDAMYPCPDGLRGRGGAPPGLTICSIPGAPDEAGDYLLMIVEYAGEIPLEDETGRYEYAVVFDSDGLSENNYVPPPEFPKDFFSGTDLWILVRYDPGFGWGVGVLKSRFPVASPARVRILGNEMAWLIPFAHFDIDEPTYRVTAFRHEGDQGLDGGPWSGDLFPKVGEDLLRFTRPVNEDCTNGEDDDGDGAVDCADPDCVPLCPELDCTNGEDDDGDRLTDCEDPDCTEACAPVECELACEIGSGGGTVMSSDGSAAIRVPAGALPQAIRLSVNKGADVNIELSTDQGMGIALYTVDIGPEGASFDLPVSVVLCWADADNDGLVDGTEIDQADLVIVKDRVVVSDRCEADPGCDQNGKCFTFDTAEFSEFALVVLTASAGLQAPGDCNQDGLVQITDPLCLLGNLFLGSPPELPCGDGTPTDPANVTLLDWNGDGRVNVADAVGALTHLFSGGPGPVLGPITECRPVQGCSAVCTP